MVATRRGARTDHTEEPEPQNESLTLRKKPVRRATAATAATSAKTSQPATRTRATRSRKAENDDEDELAAPHPPQETSEEPEHVTKRATRLKRAETVEPEPSRATKPTKTAPQPKRATRTAVAKPYETTQEAEPAQKAPAAVAKPALAARPARQTRAKTPAAQSPLSPKKITQVSRARTRGAKVAEDEKVKPIQRTRPVPATQTSRTSRKRAVSDENAGIPELNPVEPTEAPIQPVKSTPPSKTSPVVEQPIEEEETMSSRETTPPASPGPEFEQPQNYTEDKIDAADLEQMDDDEKAEQSASDDELSGPKTPMRRTRQTRSQATVRSKSSVKRQDPDVPAHTPPRRRVARGTTPQTSKPCNRTATSESAVRPMTVARANDRPFVFRKLEKDSQPDPDFAAQPVAENEKTVEDEEVETPAEEIEEQEQASEDDVEMAEMEDEALEHTEDEHAHDPDETIVVEDDSADEHEDLELVNSPTIDPPTYSHENVEEVSDEESTPVKPQTSEKYVDDDHSSLIETPVADYDDEDDMEVDSPTVEPPVASYEVDADGSVIIQSRDDDESEESSEDEHDDCTMFGLKTPRPETIPWQNIREDTTIPIDFDLHFADVRTPARVDDDFSFGAASVFQNLHSGVEEPLLEPDHDLNQLDDEPTINLNDFVDIAALAEPTVQLDAVPSAASTEDNEASEREPAPSEMDDTKRTVIITNAEPADSVKLEREEEQDGSYDAPQLDEQLRSSTMRRPSAESPAIDHQIETDPVAPSGDMEEVLEEDDEPVPHYAWSTLSSRRKSLPALGNQTPVRSDARPTTSDGNSVARIARPFDQSWWTRSRRSSVVAIDSIATPVRSASTRRSSSARRSTAVIQRDSNSVVETPTTQTGERFPRCAPRDRYDGQFEAQTVSAPSRFRTPSHGSTRYPATVQKMAHQQGQQVPIKGPSKPSTPGSVRKLSHGSTNKQAQSFNVPFRIRAQATTPTQHTPTASKTVYQESSETTSSTAESSSHTTPQERFPRRSARQIYDQHARTVAPTARFHTPIQGKPRRPATVQRLTSQTTSQAESSPRHVTPKQTPRGPKSQTKPSAVTPQARFPRLPAKEAYEIPVEAETRQQPATPKERFPRLPPKQTYDERASTVIAPSRFRSPAPASPRRPATSQKPVNLRKVALKSSAPSYGSHTPIKTPLKAPAETPSQVPMTPHPGAPLRGVVALVEVFTLDGASASAPFISLLQRLGARTTKTWSERVTHVIFKDGSPTTLQRVRLNNKEVESTRKGFIIHCVNSRWVSDCDASGSRVDEDDDAYAVDVTDVPRGGNRRRKSMEPSALINIGGNIVRDRKSSGRQSIGRSAMKLDSSEKKSENDVEFTPVAKWTGLQDDDDFEDDESEISTPDYLAAPDKLIQMTAPANRVRKLDLQKDASKNRRMTSFWEGGD